MSTSVPASRVPRFYRVNESTQFDYSTMAKKYFTIKPSNGDSAANLNNGENITFSYEGQKKFYRLADPESGIFVKIGYRTKTGANRDQTANITLANDWFGHMFSSVRFRIGSQDLESINEFGVVMDTLNHLAGDEFRHVSGEDYTWIPDTDLGVVNGSFTVGAPTAVRNPAAAAQANVTETANLAATAVINAVNLALSNIGSALRVGAHTPVAAAGATVANIGDCANEAAVAAIAAVNNVLRYYNIKVGPHATVGDAAGTAAANIATSCNAAATAAIAAINNALQNASAVVNKGFFRRMLKYNYGVRGDDRHRRVTAFIPLSMIFGCCCEDKLLRNINFEINLTRKQNTAYTEVFYGANGTDVEFGDPATTGILNMSLRLVEYIPNPNLTKELSPLFTKPINWTYKQRHCILRSSALDKLAISESKQTVPQFIFVLAKGNTDNANQKGAVDRNFSLFRHCDMKSVVVDLDGERYPNEPQNANFFENNYSAFYQQFRKACKLVGGSECSVSSIEYRDLYTIFAIDTSCKPLKLRNAVSNMVVNIERNAIPGDNNTPINPLNVDYYVLSINEKSYDINCETGEVKEVYL